MAGRRIHLALPGAIVLAACGLAVSAGPAAAPPATQPPPPAPAGHPAVPPSPTLPSDAVLEAGGAVVGEILVRVGNIFDLEDPEENNRFFRIANRLHRPTREHVIRRLLLFRPGDPYQRGLLEESERLLRSTRYLYDAEIYPVRYEDGRVTVQVVTRDVWTLRLGVGYSRTGGENTTRIGVRDTNFLGTGKQILLRRISDVDRTSKQVRYVDPNLRGSRVNLHVGYDSNSDGNESTLLLDRPFYSLDARWAAALELSTRLFENRRYELGQVVEEFAQERDEAVAAWGLSDGKIGRSTRRWTFGVTYRHDRFAAIPGVTAGPLPEDRKLVFPWIGLVWLHDGFVELHDLDRIDRTEDVNLGHELRAQLGLSSPTLGADDQRIVANYDYAYGRRLSEDQILLLETYFTTRIRDSRDENTIAGVAARYYLRNFGRHVFYAAASFDTASRLDRDVQLLLGGDTGLRGYPLRYLVGDRKMLFTLEQRLYTKWHLAKLVHVGAAVFADVGRVWSSDNPAADPGLLKDVGFGLRLGSSRSSSKTMIHIDVAFPLDGDPSIDRAQFLVTSRETF